MTVDRPHEIESLSSSSSPYLARESNVFIVGLFRTIVSENMKNVTRTDAEARDKHAKMLKNKFTKNDEIDKIFDMSHEVKVVLHMKLKVK